MSRRFMPLTPRQLRKMADDEDDVARLATVRAQLYRRTADELERLSPASPGASVSGDMQTTPSNLLRSAAADRKGTPLVAAANAAGYSMRRLALEMGIDHGLLSKYAKGERSIPRDRAEAIERLIGYPANGWPKVTG